MTKRCLVSMVLGVAVAAILSVPAQAQGMDKKPIFASVDFPFYTAETSHPAGSYEISAPNFGAETVTLRPSGGKDTISMSVITRLAQRGGATGAQKADLVFDTVGDRKYLSEVWIPGREGYLVRATSEAHEHAVVESTK